MTLDEIFANVADQEKGRWFELHEPVSGAATGIKLRVAGPDSATAGRARLQLFDELADAADVDGRVSAEAKERARLNSLAALVLDWEISEAGEPVPFATANLLRLIRVAWIHQQVDAFASDRAAHRGVA